VAKLLHMSILVELSVLNTAATGVSKFVKYSVKLTVFIVLVLAIGAPFGS